MGLVVAEEGVRWGTFENGRKAGVESAESPELSSSSSAEETGFKVAVFPFDFEDGKRGRRVNMRLWVSWGLEEEDDEEDDGLDPLLGEVAVELCSWLAGREGRVSESMECLGGRGLVPKAVCIAAEDFWTCVTVVVEAVREHVSGFDNRQYSARIKAMLPSKPRPNTGVLGVLPSFLKSRLPRGRMDSAEGPREARPSLEGFWFSNDFPTPPPLSPRLMAYPPAAALPDVDGGVGEVPLVGCLLTLRSCSRTWES